MTPFHMIGATLGLAVAAAIWNETLISGLKSILPQQQVDQILKSSIGLNELDDSLQREVKTISAKSYNEVL